MSSVEQKIREVLENVAIEYGEYPSPKTINVDQATQSILQIIASDAYEQEKRVWGLRELAAEYEISYWKQKRVNLREEKS